MLRFGIKILYAFILLTMIGFISLFVVPVIIWHLQPSNSLNIWIVDKTVPLNDYREHKGLMWMLNYSKVLNAETNTHFKYGEDYFGYFPGNDDDYTIREIPWTEEKPNLIYLADTYGVYADDELLARPAGTAAQLKYGGINAAEMDAVYHHLGGGNTIIGEFNIASSPTNQENRKRLSQLFGVDWLGWAGRYYNNLDRYVEVPESIVAAYEQQQGKPWDFSGSGFILVSDMEQIVILEKNLHFSGEGIQLIFDSAYKQEFSIDDPLTYQYWFEFVKERPGREVLANYKLYLTDEGQNVLGQLGLPDLFPAVIRHHNTQYTAYYLAGDFVDQPRTPKFWCFSWFDKIKRFSVSLSPRSHEENDYFYWKGYVPMMDKIIADLKEHSQLLQAVADPLQTEKPTAVKPNMLVRTSKNAFLVLKNDLWQELYIKGVNIGAALPGKWFTEFPEDERIYLDWLIKIGQMNANSIRTYTLLPPEFYHALAYYNKTHPENMLWLFQEIWPEENPPEHNYLADDYIREYLKEIEYAVDAIHGMANIPERTGRAFGIYTADVSPYIAGYLVGRELEPEEVIATNELNENYIFRGDYLKSKNNASPTESWLAMNCDYVLAYEESVYGWQHPVAIVSWPTLDPQEHDSEWNITGNKLLEYNDKAVVDINNIEPNFKMSAGFFGAYHIYPNYPDFMNNEPSYDNYSDQSGRLRYGGYLQEFMQQHTEYPALVAEFGLATGMGNAHSSPDGYDHGGMTETEQGEGIVRMMKTIKNEGYAGGLIFEWQDEWAKKTWITEPFMIPYDRQALWHNIVDPEQNYGILAQESDVPQEPSYREGGSGEIIREISLKQDEAYLYIDIDLRRSLDDTSERLLLGIDSYDRIKGEFKYLPQLDMPTKTGLEFLVTLNGENDSFLLVHPGYNISRNKFSSYTSDLGLFEEISTLINGERFTKQGLHISAIYHNDSKLSYGPFINNSKNNWYIEGKTVHLRIPWGRINVSDPSSLQVLDDNSGLQNPLRDQLQTRATDGIIVSSLIYDPQTFTELDRLEPSAPFLWTKWDVPGYQERLKESYYIIRDYFATLP